MAEESWLKSRYQDLGGVEQFALDFQAGKVSVRQVAARLGVSYQTIYNDLRRAMGKDLWQATQTAKFGPRTRKARPASLTIADAINRIASDETFIAGGNADLICSVLRIAEENGAEELSFRGDSIHQVRMSVGWCNLRIYITKETLFDYKLGFYRVRPPLNASPSGFDIFVVCDKSFGIIFYIYHKDELGSIQSLNLRFKPDRRNNKRSHERNNWKKLEGRS